ncbi:hypothetical protein EHS25_010207 [Saitozyma podzolica]|uniref:Right handed beta helix domain-containing protein n=1 Tax=Saitozyma podzolica TaxID=1890683 RepID=A0A427YIX7_9TREE|nr:hypothetical protein EHS25_010207 [Saitozyma podzolica]
MPRLGLSLLCGTLIYSSLLSTPVHAACIPNTTDTPGLQNYLTSGGQSYTLSLCQGQIYNLTDILNYTAPYQEISTEGYPTDSNRATLLVGGFNISTAIYAQGSNLTGVALRNVQIDGNRGDSPIYTASNANLEFGGANSGQIVEYVKSYDPRGWSCLHIAEGPFTCSNMTVQHNDIGPCGSDSFQQWADGVSLSCAKSLVQHNTIVDATDGGIVIFGSPYSVIHNNTIHVQTRTLLGGINMVDIETWLPYGNFSGVLVENNTINGGFATEYGNSTLGKNNASAIIKVGIAIGPDVWWGDLRYGTNKTSNSTVRNNVLSGAFAFGLAISSSYNLTFENNTFVNNASFSASYGPNCTTGSSTPHDPVSVLLEPNTVSDSTISMPSFQSSPLSTTLTASNFQIVNGTALGLTCFLPPGPTSSPTPTAAEVSMPRRGRPRAPAGIQRRRAAQYLLPHPARAQDTGPQIDPG